MITGKVDYDKEARQWVITCEPHISLRLRRWFAKLGKAGQKNYRISDTPEVARDLKMFVDRFGLQMNGYANYLDERVTEHVETEKAILSVYDGSIQAEPFELAIPAREYQRIAAQLALRTHGLLIGDDLGLGKTLCAIAMFTRPETLPALVITMAHLPTQWKNEIHKFAPNLTTHVIKSTKPYDYNNLSGADESQAALFGRRGVDVVITNYHKAAPWADLFSSGVIKTLVLDECQEVRRDDSDKYRAIKSIAQNVEWRVGLSATPIYNYGDEFHNIFEILAPHQLGSKGEFLQEWCGTSWGDKVKIENPKAFGVYLRNAGLMIRRTREEVGRELPMLTKVPYQIDADLGALKSVSEACAELARIVLGITAVTKKEERSLAGSEMLNKLRQATGIAKAPYVADMVRMMVESGEKVLLAGWHREVYAVWLDKLKDLKPVMYTGTETTTQKESAVNAFKLNQTPVFIMSNRSGAGLDQLQYANCRTVVHGELDYSPAVHDQINGRIWRDGQKDKIIAYYPIADYGSDPIIADILGLKRQQLEGVIDPDRKFAEMQTDPDYIKKLATDYLRQIGIKQ